MGLLQTKANWLQFWIKKAGGRRWQSSRVAEHSPRLPEVEGSYPIAADLASTSLLKVSKIDCLRFVMCQLLPPFFQGFFFATAICSTNEAHKAGGMRH